MASIYIEVIVIMDDGADQRILVAKTFHRNELNLRKPVPVIFANPSRKWIVQTFYKALNM